MWTLLFDIDGTLIRTHGAGMGAMGQAIIEHYGHQDIPEVRVTAAPTKGSQRNCLPSWISIWTRIIRAFLTHIVICSSQL